MTFFVLIVRLHNNVRLKILETKNATKIRKEVSVLLIHTLNGDLTFVRVNQLICVRKFLGLEDHELAIYDETRQKDGTKLDNRYHGEPKTQQLINSKGESMNDEFPELIEDTGKQGDTEDNDAVDMKQD